MFGTAGGQTGPGAGRHPEDQQGAAAAVPAAVAAAAGRTAGRGAHRGGVRRVPVRGRRADRRVPVDVRAVRSGGGGRGNGRGNGGGRRGQFDGYRAGGQAEAVHVGHGRVQPGVLRPAGRRCRRNG